MAHTSPGGLAAFGSKPMFYPIFERFPSYPGSTRTTNGVLPAGDPAPYNGTQAPRIVWTPEMLGRRPSAPRQIGPQPRLVVPQDATQTAEQLNGGRKKIKLPEGGVIIALAAAVLFLPTLLK